MTTRFSSTSNHLMSTSMSISDSMSMSAPSESNSDSDLVSRESKRQKTSAGEYVPLHRAEEETEIAHTTRMTTTTTAASTSFAVVSTAGSSSSSSYSVPVLDGSVSDASGSAPGLASASFTGVASDSLVDERFVRSHLTKGTGYDQNRPLSVLLLLGSHNGLDRLTPAQWRGVLQVLSEPNCAVNQLQMTGYSPDMGSADEARSELEMTRVAELLRVNRSITFLSLTDRRMDVACLTILCNAMCENRTVVDLHLDCSSIGSDGCPTLARLITRNKTLKALRLAHNPLGPDGSLLLIHALPSNEHLEQLNLGHTGFHSCLYVHVLRALEVNQRLDNLNEEGRWYSAEPCKCDEADIPMRDSVLKRLQENFDHRGLTLGQIHQRNQQRRRAELQPPPVRRLEAQLVAMKDQLEQSQRLSLLQAEEKLRLRSLSESQSAELARVQSQLSAHLAHIEELSSKHETALSGQLKAMAETSAKEEQLRLAVARHQQQLAQQREAVEVLQLQLAYSQVGAMEAPHAAPGTGASSAAAAATSSTAVGIGGSAYQLESLVVGSEEYAKEEAAFFKSFAHMKAYSNLAFHITRIERVRNFRLDAQFASTFAYFSSRAISTSVYRAYHSTRAENIPSILEQNLSMKKQGQLDDGWFGAGFYFSDHADYVFKYYSTGHFEKIEIGESGRILCFDLMPGRTRQLDTMDLGRPRAVNTDSNTSPNGYERVMFDQRHFTPKYVIHFRVTEQKGKGFEKSVERLGKGHASSKKKHK